MPCARLQSPGRTDPFRVIGYPSRPDRSYMLNEQFTWLTPFSQQASPELTWCDQRNAEAQRAREHIRRAGLQRRPTGTGGSIQRTTLCELCACQPKLAGARRAKVGALALN